MSRPFSIAFICTGNRFRSPLAAAFVERLTLGLPVRVETAGILELVGAPALEVALQVALVCGVDLSAHRSQPLSSVRLDDVDVVLGFEEEHVRHAIVDGGAARSRSFTFREFVELLRHVMPRDAMGLGPVERARAGVEHAAELRHEVLFAPRRANVADSFGRSAKAQRDTAAEIRELSLRLVDGLFGTPTAGGLLPVPEKIGGRRWLVLSPLRSVRQRLPRLV